METFDAITYILVCMSIVSLVYFSILADVGKRYRRSILYCLSEESVEELAKLVRGQLTELSEETRKDFEQLYINTTGYKMNEDFAEEDQKDSEHNRNKDFVSDDLKRFAEEWDESLYRSDAVIAGAKWQEQQMMKDAIEVEIIDPGTYTIIKTKGDTVLYGRYGDKVKLLIIKEE